MITKNRRPARRLALQALYEMDCTQHAIEDVLTPHLTGIELDPELRSYVYELTIGVQAHKTRMDLVIQDYAPEWPLDQVAIIDRNLLRMAIFEFAISGNTPAKVAINESVDLAKEFGSESSSRFVNGVLGALMAHEAEVRARLEAEQKS